MIGEEHSPRVPTTSGRYEQFRDGTGSWTFEFEEYQADLNAVASIEVPPDPGPTAAYRPSF